MHPVTRVSKVEFPKIEAIEGERVIVHERRIKKLVTMTI